MISANGFRNYQKNMAQGRGLNRGAATMFLKIMGLAIILFVAAGSISADPGGETRSAVYDPEILIPLLIRDGETVAISPILHVIYFQEHKGARSQDHISSYLSLFGAPEITASGIVIMPFRLSFNREIWTKNNRGIWIIDQRIAADRDLDGRLDEYACQIIEEAEDGAVLSIQEKACDESTIIEAARSMAIFFSNPPKGI